MFSIRNNMGLRMFKKWGDVAAHLRKTGYNRTCRIYGRKKIRETLFAGSCFPDKHVSAGTGVVFSG
jgi:hypothetical protein